MMELIVASSSVDTGIGCWDLVSGAEQLRYRSSASPPHGLISVSRRFLASSQLRENPSSSSAPIFFWSWEKPQVQVRSFPAEPIGPLVSDSDGSYIIGGGPSGAIYLWEVASGKLLNKWTAHYRSVTCLTLSDDESLLISGSEDGSIRVWPLLMIFDDIAKESGENIYRYNFSEHALRVTSVISGHGLCNSIVISSSEDRTCKVWSLSEGRLLRSISFPSIIDAIAMDPGEHIFYAGCRDGKIYVAALNVEWNPVRNYGKFIIDSLSDNSKAITCLAFSLDGVSLVSGSEDGMIRVWNTKTGQMTRLLKHAKAPVSNVIIVRQPNKINQVSLSKKLELALMAPPLDKYTESREDGVESKAVKMIHQISDDLDNSSYCAASVMSSQIKELQQNASTGAVQMELERLRAECKRSMQMVQQWKKLYNDLQTTFVNELLNGVNVDGS
ncbi:protein ROOT INITIATION DEFECTIVE 3 [Dendrobium catenatum]|uniref:Guanine nucleotide-binding protein subunit beta-like protein B n=1 Tax=Dendrobium catenatum TaxID=906689 RepID=A0A2I0XC51_9ASPA|nr:protein ROOT INITIATION DEFECTIVE 3 [Dendrobium catenatum]XP_020701718.1 protein ROOT INITIATION DEFECTIVE 3 [Dendrobium catenatum]PKU85490.1 Guanine nucleotide-binding protein subunit beta-like protein B [Dendrobium catenatum]